MTYPNVRNSQLVAHHALTIEDQIQRLTAVDSGHDAKPKGRGAIGGIIVHRGVKPLYVSEGWAALHGYEAAEVLSMPSIEPLRHPDDRARMTAYGVERAAGRFVPKQYAYRALHKDGSFIWVDISVCVIPWQSEPAILCTILGVRDSAGAMTGRPRGVRHSTSLVELRLLNVIDQLPDGYALFDADERLVIWNERYVSYAPKIGLIYRAGDRFEALIRDHVRHGRIKEAIGQEEAWIAKRLSSFRASDNRSVDISYSGRVVQARHIKTNDGGTLLIVTDVTEARATSRALSIHASAIDQISDGVALMDLDYRFVFVNKAFLGLFGKSLSDLIGRHLAEVSGEEQFLTASKKDLDRCFAGDRVKAKRSIRDADGEPFHLELTLEPFRDSDGELIGAIAVLRDVTDVVKRTEDLQLSRSAIDQLSERIMIVDSQEHIKFANQSSLKFHHREANQVVGKHLSDLIGWDRYHDDAAQLLRRVLVTGIPSRHEYWRSTSDDEPQYWETTVVPYRESDSTISGAIATSRDMTDHHLAEQNRQHFQEAIEHIADGYALFDKDERLIACNQYYHLKQSSSTPSFALGNSFETIIRGRVEAGSIADAIGREEEWIAERLQGFRSEANIAEFREANGKWTQVRNLKTADGGTLLVVTDVTAGKRIKEALAKSQSRFKDFTELAADWFWELDAEGRYTYVSDSIGILTNRPLDELLGKTPIQVLGFDVNNDPKWRALWQELQTTGIDRTVDLEYDLKAMDDRIYRVRTVVRPIKNASGMVVGYRGAAKDITENYRLAKKLEYQANHDSLTGLFNRRSFERELERAIKASNNGRRSSVFCFVDLDQFKIVNDTAGHLAGDRLLQQVADLLSTKIRKGDILARLGGDEFGLLLYNCSLRRAKNMAKKLIATLNDDRFLEGDNVFEIGASIGLTQVKVSTSSIGQLMAEADLACYAAKDAGRNRVHVYQHDDQQLTLRRDEMSKASLIRWALDEGHFKLFAQPIMSLTHPERSMRRYEILLRMLGGDGSLLLPGTFISAAERYGLMTELDRWVINQSFIQLSDVFANQDEIQININLSGLSLNEEGLEPFICKLFQRFPIAPENVCFEITETAAIRSMAKTKTLIGKLKKIGCQFALDDFGSGLSSFSYLKQLPVDYMKIDGSFIRDMRRDQRSRSMVEAIHQVAKSLDLKTVAECVETKETYDILQDVGVDFVQGHFIGRPMPLDSWAAGKAVAV